MLNTNYYSQFELHCLKTLFIAVCVLCESCSQDKKPDVNETSSDMIWIEGGEFEMGTDEQESYSHEGPAHRVKVKGFWIDKTEVTNKDFKEFVKATGYKTVAERKPVWEELKTQVPPGTPAPPDSLLVPGSLVFHAPAAPVALNDYTLWWAWTPGASWRHPEGPGSTITDRMNHPVVHIAYADALAYCKWKGKRLPTEAEWELAARGGMHAKRFAWGDELTPQGRYQANTFQGSFPSHNTQEDGFLTTAPVASFPPNAFGLYDMIGNVWEWTSDWYDAAYYQRFAKNDLPQDPQGAERPFDPDDPYAIKRVTKGGSFLCAQNYCSNFRPSARQGTAHDSGASHIGFRCVKN